MSRLNTKQRNLTERLRTQIVSGRLGPGSRLPTREQLGSRFRASTHTVQRAMDDLLREGFIRSQGTLGTFVAEHPPHLCEYALVFPFRPNTRRFWSRFFATLQQVALAMQDERCRITCYYGSEGLGAAGEPPRENPQLARAIHEKRVAGVVFCSPPYA